MPKAVRATAAEPTSSAVTCTGRPVRASGVDAGSAPLCGTIDSVSFVGDRQRMIVSAASDKPLTVDAPNTVQAKAGEQVGLSIAPQAVRLLPLEG